MRLLAATRGYRTELHGRLAGWLMSVGVETLSKGPMTIRPSPEMVMGRRLRLAVLITGLN